LHGARWGVNLPMPHPLPANELRQTSNEEWMARLLEVYGEDDPGKTVMNPEKTPGPAQRHRIDGDARLESGAV
jgi:hypothetical protein